MPNADYGSWSYEQIVNAVLSPLLGSLTVPDRAEVMRDQWLDFSVATDWSVDPNRELLWKLDMYTQHDYADPAQYQPTRFRVYADQIFYNTSSAIRKWMDLPPAAIQPAAFTSPRNLTGLHIDPNGMIATGNALMARQFWFFSKFYEFDGRVKQLDNETAAFKGKAAEVFTALLTNLRNAFWAFYSTMGESFGSDMGIRVGYLGQVALPNFIDSIWNAFAGYLADYRSDPRKIAKKKIDEEFDPPETWQVTYVPSYALPGQGATTVSYTARRRWKGILMTDQPAWQTFEKSVKDDWLKGVQQLLDGPAQAAMGPVVSAYQDAIGVLKPLTLPPMRDLTTITGGPATSLNSNLNSSLNSHLNSNLNSSHLSNTGLHGSGLNNTAQHGSSLNSTSGISLNNAVQHGSSLNNASGNPGTTFSQLTGPSGYNLLGNNLLGNDGVGNGVAGGLVLPPAALTTVGLPSTGPGSTRRVGTSLDTGEGGGPAVPVLGRDGPLPGAAYTAGSRDVAGPIATRLAGLGGSGGGALVQQVSSGRFSDPNLAVTIRPSGEEGTSGIPFYPPMGGMGGMGGMGDGEQTERERSTYMAEDALIWGTEPDAAPAVVGRDAARTREATQGGRSGAARVGKPSRERERGRERRR